MSIDKTLEILFLSNPNIYQHLDRMKWNLPCINCWMGNAYPAASALGPNTGRCANIRDNFAGSREEQIAPRSSLFETQYVDNVYVTKVYIFTRQSPTGKVIRDGLADRLPSRAASNSAAPFPSGSLRSFSFEGDSLGSFFRALTFLSRISSYNCRWNVFLPTIARQEAYIREGFCLFYDCKIFKDFFLIRGNCNYFTFLKKSKNLKEKKFDRRYNFSLNSR